jgi:menaquinone-dependent protoporphyrinogen IX oxidase
MADTAVIYASRYGATKQYAQWLKEALHADLYVSSEFKKDDFKKYQTIIFGGGLYASGINGIALIKKNMHLLEGKNIIIFTVGLENPKNVESFVPIIERNFTDEMREKISVFHLHGSMDYNKLSFMHRSMMGMVKKMVEKKSADQRTQEDNEMLRTFGDKVDFVDKAAIAPIVELAESYG